MKLEVHKFGGTSVGSHERIAHAAGLIADRLSAQSHSVVVASAMTKVTDALISAAADAARGARREAETTLAHILVRHLDALGALAGDRDESAARTEIEGIVDELRALIGAASALGELSPRTRDRLVSSGEKLSVRLLAARFRAIGVEAVAVDADTFLDTDDRFGEATPLRAVAERTTRSALRPLIEKRIVPVVTGFTGRAPDGATTTLGRGGSDFSATFVAGALGADEVTIWTDVDGVYSSDPRIVPDARVIAQLNYREAAELSFYGAKVLHQRTMIPVAGRGIPVVTRNSFNPDAPGTRIDDRFTPGSHPVKAISAIRGHALMSVEGKGMAGVPGVAAMVFGALAERAISVTMISQSSSESSITFAVPQTQAVDAERALKQALRTAMARGDIEEIATRGNVSLVAAVGLGMARKRGVAARVFETLAKAEVNILAIAQGSSELNISLAVDGDDTNGAIRAVHREFGLHRRDVGRDSAADLDLMLLGCGNIGRALVEQVLDRSSHLFERFGLRARIVAVADRSGYLANPRGFELERLREILDAKASGQSVATLAGGVTASAPEAMVEALLDYRLARPILVDVSDSDVAVPAFLAALRGGCDVVTANKKPLAGALDDYRELAATAASERRLVRGEATVGAGLPVIDTVRIMLDTGDRIVRAQGCLSGTLGFVMDALEREVPLSKAVADAVEAGYTEPDPVADLSGADVARKAVILSRLCGLSDESTPVELTGLVSDALSGLPLGTLNERLQSEYDDEIGARVRAAKERGEVLRYVAAVEAGSIRVGPQTVPADSPLGMLKGTDNMIVFGSERYDPRPLVVSGPGAGIEVTAMGVLGDILRIAAERRRG